MGDISSKIASVADAEYFAKRRVPKSVYQHIDGGSVGGVAIRENVAAFERVTFRPHVGVWNESVDLSVTVVGNELAMPVLIAPTGNIRFIHKDGELGVARAAAGAGTAMCVSTVTGYPIEDITAATSAPTFYQVFFLSDRDTAEYGIERAKAAGCKALVLTVDTGGYIAPEWHVLARRELPMGKDLRAVLRFAPQAVARLPWLLDFIRDPMPLDAPMGRTRGGEPMDMWQAFGGIFAGETPVPTWRDLEWIRELWGGPIIVKGILSVDDARRAVDEGASAVVVSNHGGMICDAVPPTVRVLPDIANAVGDDIEVLVDSGIRRGLDVVKAMALGARAVLIGHAYLWPFAAAGEAGVSRILSLFRDDIEQGLRLLGCPSVRQLDRSYLTDYPGSSARSNLGAEAHT